VRQQVPNGLTCKTLKEFMSMPESKRYGGGGGKEFSDHDWAKNKGPITNLIIHWGQYVDSLQVIYGHGGGSQAPKHGGGGGVQQLISLEPGEQIITVFGRAANFVDALGFITQRQDGTMRLHGPYGGNGGTPFCIVGKVDYFFGRSYAWLDAIGVVTATEPLVWAP
jgi:hypothetical protein